MIALCFGVNSAATYRESIEKIETFTKYLWYAMCSTVAICGFAPLPYTLVRFFIYDMGEKSFYLYAPSWYPFDWRNPFGYLVAFISQFLGVAAVGNMYTHFFNLFFASCWILLFIADDIANDVNDFNAAATQIPDGNRTELTKRFCDLVQIYSDAKQCAEQFNQIYEYPLLSFFGWNMLALSSTLVTLQFELWADADSFEIIIVSYLVIVITSYIFLLCEPGARMTTRFETIEDNLYQCDWHLLSIELQQMYMIFLANSQNPVNIQSFGGIICERETKKKILNKAWSYFMTLRSFPQG